jgi:4-azaleucine resistance transporter AzlC
LRLPKENNPENDDLTNPTGLTNPAKETFKRAVISCLPVIFGYVPTGFIFGFLLVSEGFPAFLPLLMGTVIYAGAGQYLAIGLLTGGSSYLNSAVSILLINSKHLFYGLSLLEKYRKAGLARLYLIFSLTDETYAVLTNPKNETDDALFLILVSVINQASWVLGCALGGVAGNTIKFDSSGMDFAMTALFLVILVEQLKAFKTKAPFIIGAASGILILILCKSQILLFGSILSVAALIIFKKRIEDE